MVLGPDGGEGAGEGMTNAQPHRTPTIQLYKGEGNMHSRNVLNAIRSQLVVANGERNPMDAQRAEREATRIGLAFIAKAGPADMNTIHRVANLLLGKTKP